MNNIDKLDVSKYGGFLISNSILKDNEVAAFWFREEGVNEDDNGWRIIGLNDTEEFLNDADNWSIVGIKTVFKIMPMILNVFDSAVGSDYQIEYTEENFIKSIYDVNNKKYIFKQ